MVAVDQIIGQSHLRSVVVTLAAAVISSVAVADAKAPSVFLKDTVSATASCRAILEDQQPTWPQANAESLIAESLTSEPFDNPRAAKSTRFKAKLVDGTDMVWTSLQTETAPVAMQITASRDGRPNTLWHLNETCEPTQLRKIIYDDDFKAVELHVINLDDGTIDSVEALNPPISSPLNTNTEPDVIRVAMVDSGVNYTLPTINQRLARDSDGELIGYDFWDNDTLPFDAQFGPSPFHVIRHGTATASLLLKEAPFVELVPYRYPRPAMQRMQALVEHAAQNKVRIVGLPLGGNKPDQWQAFAAAAKQHPDILFIASAGNNGRSIDSQPVYPAALDLANLLVVTSADDYVIPAEGANWGRTNVDYMLPAEQQDIINFAGQPVQASGSSYAVPRAMAMAARWLRSNPNWQADELIAEFSRRFADGASAQYVGGGYIADPLADEDLAVELVGVQTLTRDVSKNIDGEERIFNLPLSVFVLTDQWTSDQINQSLLQAESILNQCQISFTSVTVSRLGVPEYLQDLNTGPARTLTAALDNNSEFNPIKVFFARDTRMHLATDGASFARANTRRRPWLQDSVWLMENIEDSGVALAHELFHVLSNIGTHSRANNNLMQAKTSPTNIEIQPNQCESAIAHAKQSMLLFD